ncbi:Zinc finger protein 782 [Liparis tanakae]|uniref:Zinc finger protein 782 n=1 Tax=Liparis tanakae TaxID=230148 RepID=A0A4Z2HKH0_9TELE|nr:Zinc finger protein 782 [Liparis tanakae]
MLFVSLRNYIAETAPTSGHVDIGRMSDLEAQVGSILEIMVSTTVTEMAKVIGGSAPTQTDGSQRTTENTPGSSEKVTQLSGFLTSRAHEAVEKICQLFLQCSSLLQLEVTQGVAEIEELRRRLEVAQTELKVVLEGSGGQELAEELTNELTEQSGGEKECEGAPAHGRGAGETVRSQRSGRKSRRAVACGDAGVKRSPIVHLWKGRTYEDCVQPVIIKEEGLEALADQVCSDSGPHRDHPGQDDDEDPDYQFEPEDADDGDPGFITRPKRVAKPPKPHRERAKRDGQGQGQGQGQQPLSCKHCRKTFTKLLQLKAHQAVHGANAEKPFHCSQCGRGFSFQRSLNAHVLLHTGERPHTCDVCGKGFTLKQLLRNHQRLHAEHLLTHAAAIPCTCVLCGRRLGSITDLRSHQQHHTVDRPHSCGLCGKSFKSSSYLKIHLKTHSGEKPFACDICGRMFTQHSSLKSHQVGLHGILLLTGFRQT